MLELILLVSWKKIMMRLIRGLSWYFGGNNDELKPRLLLQDNKVYRSVPLRSELTK